MNDKDLIDFAAKAAGIEYEVLECGAVYMHQPEHREWNPLTDDGDAFRLAVKLRIKIQMHDAYYPYVSTETPGVYYVEDILKNNGDYYAATRRAITRVAAEIGSKA